ncbi:NADH dehydrogenase (Ubiquinone) 1 beta subcomplex 7 [Puccinia sorghi]|uniref:NADH dehydrogenase [ubiquinone] 1 beta subcomplex subunit 7 n=1 Tax=Puccinia sorghi TaxID=27349 RepID=A0A0L6UQ81_9BASI|nr:NADH dehydrogenase (Ubiquinone) 1 beta subcomplex 7 [Puccinia sorghi]
MTDIGIASQEDMKKARLPLGYRDSCANFLITLNKCRHKGNFMPWNCGDERHAYEHCQYKEYAPNYVKRMKQMQQQVQASKNEAS